MTILSSMFQQKWQLYVEKQEEVANTVRHRKPAGFLQANIDIRIMRTDLIVRSSDLKTEVVYDFPKKYFLIHAQHNSTQH